MEHTQPPMEHTQPPNQSFCFQGELTCVFICLQVMLTFSAVFGVIVYRITTAAALSFSTNETTRSNVRVTVTATAVVINLVVVLILDEIYGAVAKWLTEIGKAASARSSLIQVLTQGGAQRNISSGTGLVETFRPVRYLFTARSCRKSVGCLKNVDGSDKITLMLFLWWKLWPFPYCSNKFFVPF